MAKIHITLQGKGGVGKSFISATTAQYKHHKGESPLCCIFCPKMNTHSD